MEFYVGSGDGDIRAATRRLLRQEEPTLDELTAEWQAVDEIRREEERPLFEDLQEMFRAQADRATRRRQRDASSQLSFSSFFDFSNILEEAKEAFEGATEAIVRAGFETATQRIDAETTFNPKDPSVKSAIQSLNAKSEDIAATTRRRINAQIRQGIAENESVLEIQERVQRILRRMADGDENVQPRARRISSTTTTTAFEAGQRRSMEKAGMAGKSWLSQRDSRVRRGHIEADGQAKRLGEPFMVRGKLTRGKEELQFPGDPTARASNVVNCRCTTLPIPDEDLLQNAQEEEPDLTTLPQLNA